MSKTPGRPKSNFRYAFLLLPREKREAMESLYAFCRYTDDLVDEGSEPIFEKQKMLADWRQEVERAYEGNAAHPVMIEMQSVIERYAIPKEYLLTLIDGCELDLTKSRYETFEDLKRYCYAVASVVGLISIEIFGYKRPETKQYAIDLGYALQLTNILRDVEEDAARGRIYLPIKDLARFNYEASDLLASVYNEQFQLLMQFECARAQKYYDLAHGSLSKEERRTLFPSQIMDETYHALLLEMSEKEFDVFSHRVHFGKFKKLRIALKCWLASRISPIRFTPLK